MIREKNSEKTLYLFMLKKSFVTNVRMRRIFVRRILCLCLLLFFRLCPRFSKKPMKNGHAITFSALTPLKKLLSSWKHGKKCSIVATTIAFPVTKMVRHDLQAIDMKLRQETIAGVKRLMEIFRPTKEVQMDPRTS